jgi:serine/threonine-protein kinase
MLPAPVRAVAPRLQLVLERAMGKQPDDRFDNGYEMAEAMRQVLGGSRGDEQQETRVSPLPVTGDPPSHKAPADARPGTEPRLDADTLQALERKLTDYVGPIARILVRTTSGRSRSLADLCSQLALSIADGAEREQFRREVGLLIRSRAPASDSVASPGAGTARSVRLPEHELERVQEALAQYVGPIARVLVRRATADASSVEALWLSLSNHIDSPAERSAFLRLR